mmetsp:Transcript_27934/g.70678  ORF Transcript_27934/g.70678 Transcript_27934/m.70678 type:complete len:272 (+) Transcript_27934:1047-1862(+)
MPARFCMRRQAVEARPESVRSPCAVCLRSRTYAELASSLPLRDHADVDARTLRTWEPWARLVCADVVVGRVPHDSPLQSPMRGTPACEGQEAGAGGEAAAAAFCSDAAADIHLGQLQVWHQHRQELGGLCRRCHFCVCDGRFAGAFHERHHRLHELARGVCHGYLLWAWALVDLEVRYSLGHSPPREYLVELLHQDPRRHHLAPVEPIHRVLLGRRHHSALGDRLLRGHHHRRDRYPLPHGVREVREPRTRWVEVGDGTDSQREERASHTP